MDWHPLIPRLYTHILWAFHVPVGTASASPPFGDSLLFSHTIPTTCLPDAVPAEEWQLSKLAFPTMIATRCAL